MANCSRTWCSFFIFRLCFAALFRSFLNLDVGRIGSIRLPDLQTFFPHCRIFLPCHLLRPALPGAYLYLEDANQMECPSFSFGRPALGCEGKHDVNDVSFYRTDIGSVDQQTPAETVGQPAENPLVFLMLKGKLHFGSAVGRQPF